MRNLKDASGVPQVRRDMEFMCDTVGRRMAGSPEEERVADYVAGRMKEMRLTAVEKLPFACRRWHPAPAELVVPDAGRKIEVQQFAHSPSAPPEGIEGDLVILEPVDYESGLRASNLEGKIGLFYGGYGESAEVFAAMHASPLKALLFVDTRLVTAWPIANGMGERFMGLARKPMACVSLMDAWALARDGARRVRLTCSGRVEDARSWNVVGEAPGSRPDGRVIVISGHMDSVSAGVGADDDASGVAAVLECARRLAGRKLRHTVRFIAFGAEEQLSVGAARYVKEQVKDLDRIGLAVNFDGIGAPLGLSTAFCTATPEFDGYMRGVLDARLQFAQVVSDACPYQDMFWFSAKGIPGVWITRKTHQGGYWYHHAEANNLENVSMEQIAWAAEAATEVAGNLATRDHWPFPRGVAAGLREKCEKFLREIF